MMWVSHETIYQALFVQGRGELRRELARCLRTGRTARGRRGKLDVAVLRAYQRPRFTHCVPPRPVVG